MKSSSEGYTDSVVELLRARARRVAPCVAQALRAVAELDISADTPRYAALDAYERTLRHNEGARGFSAALESTGAGCSAGGRDRFARVLALRCLDAAADPLGALLTLLTPPSRPEVLPIVRYSVVLELRSAFDFEFNVESLTELCRAYEGLRDRIGASRAAIRARSLEPTEQFLIDLLAMTGHLHRWMEPGVLGGFLDEFERSPLGIDPTSGRSFGSPDAEFELSFVGGPPDLATVQELAFGQPIGVPGLAEALHGFVPIPVLRAEDSAGQSGGRIALLTGAPGSGKTSICLSVAARAAEMGCHVHYIATEEQEGGLRSKLLTAGGPDSLTRCFAPALRQTSGIAQRLRFRLAPYDDDLETIDALVTELEAPSVRGPAAYPVQEPEAGVFFDDDDEASGSSGPGPTEHQQSAKPLTLDFTRVLVIDSLAVFLETQLDDESQLRHRRRRMGRLLQKLRESGVLVVLVGGNAEARNPTLTHLVDDVIRLPEAKRAGELDGGQTPPVRRLVVAKSRYQGSATDAQVLHLGVAGGIRVSPSLSALASHTRRRERRGRRDGRVAVLWQPDDSRAAPPSTALVLQSVGNTLIHGRGTASKSRVAMATVLEPRVRRGSDLASFSSYLTSRRERSAAYREREVASIRRSRILVLSFFGRDDYYRDALGAAVAARGVEYSELTEPLTVMALRPGYLTPEQLVADLREHLDRAELDGRPYTAAILDGIQNVQLEFPLIEAQPVLWSSLFDLLRHRQVDVVSIFTRLEPSPLGAGESATVPGLPLAERKLWQLLVNRADHALQVERTHAVSRSIEVSLTGLVVPPPSGVPARYTWDPDRHCLRAPLELEHP